MEVDNILQRHVSIEIRKEDENLVSSIRENMEKVSHSPCICRVPEKFLKENKEKYYPTLVSIGPLHHGKANLIGKEDQKWRYLNTLLSRKPNLEASLHNCVKALKDLEGKARKCYGEEIHLVSDEFVKMMLVDGCFIIELFLKYTTKGLRRRDDPFFKANTSFFLLRCDLMLLENQIPFFVLHQLFHIVPIPKHCSHSLTELALLFFRKMIPGDINVIRENCGHDFNHLLDLIHQCHIPTQPQVQSRGAHKDLVCASATNLKKNGIKFKKAAPDKSLLDIDFIDGVLEIPPLKIHNYTVITWMNLIAMEDCCHDCSKHVTSYAFLMACLIQSNEDVRLLSQKKILTNDIKEFKKIHAEVNETDFYYKGLCDQINDYGKHRRHVQWEKIKQWYKKTPLGIAGFLAILFLVFTFTGTLFSVLSFSLHHF